ncbi:MAG: UDP-N-acetylmuramoyl-tripeptide--D-alanyl-D-alanine ligase [Oscillospiraceae bacterium]|nr:UDP-N-acetylmuramoyl-tripeptide--D-alanyl-D-alanine ligase [Oscillospiraceae bacterium]
MENLTAAYIARLCDGTLVGEDADVSAIVRDNREIRGGELFCAICGENFDGHSFVSDAVKKGAAAVLVSKETEGLKAPQIVVDDTVSALGKIAKGYLEALSLHRVCITGSVGKTTTKEMCAAVLSKAFVTHKTQGNYNNNIGLPLTVFGLDKTHEAAVFEIGTNHFGEILPLAKIASPHIAVITTIGSSHLEAFGTKEGVLSEKTEILKGLTENGVAVLNGDDPLLWGIRNTLACKVRWFGTENIECDVFGEILKNGAYESRFGVRGSDTEFMLTCGGEHNVRNALAAIAVGRELGMDDASIAEGLSEFINTGMRQDIYDYNGITVIRDCYNANPDSVRAAIGVLRDADCSGKRICVLGDMRELGENSEKLHREVGTIASAFADVVLVTGEFSHAYKAGATGGNVFVFEDKKALAEKLSEITGPGDAVLVKGSYGTKMWQVLEYLQGERE